MQEDLSHYNSEGTVLRKAQLRMLDILVVMDQILKKHDIPYWLDYGTLLGAVRHGGFIPWDDDLDISVHKKDFKKIREIFSKELPSQLTYQDWKNEPKLSLKCAKIRDLNSYFDDGMKKGDMKHQGIFVDVFPVEDIVSLGIKKKIDALYGRCFRRLRGIRTGKLDYVMALLLWPLALTLEGVSNFILNFKKGGLISNVYGGLNIPVFHPKNKVFPLSKITFEGIEFPAPNDYDAHLTHIYKNYMTIPPVEKRFIHAGSIEFFD
ncbi:MAG: lipopolysaccharide cholinephosphotransferase [Lentimonas sp.]|jgi:lipopolysaccharide cholinephosphotransferase